jgi:polyhydroxyalkanoate synthesis regulator protein
VPRDGAELDYDQIWAWCEARMPAFMVPRYLEATMTGFSRQQEEMRRGMEQALKPFSLEEISQRNITMMERAMSLFSPFQGRSELDALKSENAALKAEISALRAKG